MQPPKESFLNRLSQIKASSIQLYCHTARKFFGESEYLPESIRSAFVLKIKAYFHGLPNEVARKAISESSSQRHKKVAMERPQGSEGQT